LLKKLKDAQEMLTLHDRLDVARHRRDGPTEGALLRLVLRSNQLDYECEVLHKPPEKELRNTNAEMETTVNGCSANLIESHFYQECCDLLMQTYERTNEDKACEFAAQILYCREQRLQQRQERRRPLPWMRYPEKLQLCRYFVRAVKLPEGERKFSERLDELLRDNSEYAKYRAGNPGEVHSAKQAWRRNTPRDDDPELSLKSIHEEWLSEGWRY